MTEVHMIYTGIIGLVPRTSGFQVAIQDACKHDHVAFVLFEKSARVSATPGMKEILPKPETGAALVAYALERVTIKVKNTIKPPALTEHPTFRRFVLPLASHAPNAPRECSDIKHGVLGGKVPITLAARTSLKRGALAATWVDYDYAWKWDRSTLPGPKSPEALRDLAQEVCHTFVIDDPELTLILRKVDQTTQTLVIKPSSKDRIEVMIGNVHKDDVFPIPKDPDDYDEHVKMYFDLASLDPPERRRLVRVDRALNDPPQDDHPHRLSPPRPSLPPGDLVRVGGANCPPALWLRV